MARATRILGSLTLFLAVVSADAVKADERTPPIVVTPAVGIPRVRSEAPIIVDAIARGVERSPTFRRLLEAINATDGLVYVSEGTCGHTYSLRACLQMSLRVSGPHRLLSILVNPRWSTGCALVESIGHELQHALEALSNQKLRTSAALSAFFRRIGPTADPGRFETTEAWRAGLAVGREAC